MSVSSSKIGPVIKIHNPLQWKEQLEKAKDSKKVVIVKIIATWCVPSLLIAPIFYVAAGKFPHVVFLHVDLDEVPSVVAELDVPGLPTCIFMRGGEVVHTIVGAKKQALLEKIEELGAVSATA